MNNPDQLKPLLRWAGSKLRLVPRLAEYWDNTVHNQYIEPFAGSACLFFALCPNKSVLSDINGELIDAYSCVRAHPRAVHNRLQLLARNKETYYALRESNPENLDAPDRTARFLYLNRFCFNGIYRTNMNGKFNVPYSESKTGKLPDFNKLKSISTALADTTLVSSDFENVVNKYVKKGDFVYLDPPYAVENRRIFRQYGPNVFGHDDLARLSDTLDLIDGRNATFLLSYAVSKEAISNFSNWNIRRVRIQRNISGFAENRRKAFEFLVTNAEHPNRQD